MVFVFGWVVRPCPRLFPRAIEKSKLFELFAVGVPVEHPQPRTAKLNPTIKRDNRVYDLAEVVGNVGAFVSFGLCLAVGGGVYVLNLF